MNAQLIVVLQKFRQITLLTANNPIIESYKNGVWCKLDYVLPVTFKEILELKENYKPSIESPNTLELDALVVLKYDGSGSHAQMQGDDIEIQTRNIIIGAARIVKIVDKAGNIIHLEDNQSGA